MSIEPGPLPRHIGIIMDGNGRWAEKRGLVRHLGHAEGAKSVREIVTSAREIGIEALTLYAFSVQNWGRKEAEVQALMELLLDYLSTERDTIMKNGIRLQGIGQLDRLPDSVRSRLRALTEASKNNDDMVLSLALSYGGREEIVDACKKICRNLQEGKLDLNAIEEQTLDDAMYTKGLPPLDLIIRTSGELRLSNFLLWQSAYAELFVTDVLWPDFGKRELYASIESYRSRQRRFGVIES